MSHPQIAAFARLAGENTPPTRVLEGQKTLLSRTMHGFAYDEVNDEIVVNSPLAQAILTFRGGASGEEILAVNRTWAVRFETPVMPERPVFSNTRQPERRLRVGYVSPDLREHPRNATLLRGVGIDLKEMLVEIEADAVAILLVVAGLIKIEEEWIEAAGFIFAVPFFENLFEQATHVASIGVLEGEDLKARVGVPESESVRRAVAEYLERHGRPAVQKAERKRATTRKRS